MCTNQEFLRLSYAEETVLLPSSGDMPEETEGRLLSQVQFGTGDLLGSFIPPVVYDTFPLGDVEVRPGERATATDGSAGTVLGVVVDSKNHRLISVLLREGHLWSRKDVDIPVRDVAKVDTAMHLNISKDEVRLLPEVNLSDPA
jgi:hypothetical protein